MKAKLEMVPMLGMAWVVIEQRRIKAAITKILFERTEECSVSVFVSGFELLNPCNNFQDTEVTGRFTALRQLKKAIEDSMKEPETQSKLHLADNAKRKRDQETRLNLRHARRLTRKTASK